MDLKVAGNRRKIQIAELEEWREKTYQVPSYIRKASKDGMTSGSRPNNSNWEIRYYYLTLMFVCSDIVSFIASAKAHI
jgi:hypothetical protein